VVRNFYTCDIFPVQNLIPIGYGPRTYAYVNTIVGRKNLCKTLSKRFQLLSYREKADSRKTWNENLTRNTMAAQPTTLPIIEKLKGRENFNTWKFAMQT